jgi:Arc/MetJ-type ribon-helix-helix transcriptional regulator
MTIDLKTQQEELIQKHIATGAYKSVEEFVERAIRMLHDEQSLNREGHDRRSDKPPE